MNVRTAPTKTNTKVYWLYNILKTKVKFLIRQESRRLDYISEQKVPVLH